MIIHYTVTVQPGRNPVPQYRHFTLYSDVGGENGECRKSIEARWGVVPWVVNFMKSDSARRDGWTSAASLKNRQKLIINGRQRTGSM